MNEDIEEIIERLEQALEDGELDYEAESCMQELDESGAGFDAVEPLLRFMERHPMADFDVAGAVVRYAEQFFDRGYENALMRSVSRRPTLNTVRMLARVKDFAKSNEQEYEQYEDVLIDVLRSEAEDEIKDSIRELI